MITGCAQSMNAFLTQLKIILGENIAIITIL